MVITAFGWSVINSIYYDLDRSVKEKMYPWSPLPTIRGARLDILCHNTATARADD